MPTLVFFHASCEDICISFVPADEKYINFCTYLSNSKKHTYLAEHIHELALALVAPLRSEDDVDAVVGAGHGLSSGQLGLSNILLAGSSGARSWSRSGTGSDAHGLLNLGNTGGNVA